ncbi:MAG TPA: endolytic transglycosylase MltG [Hanamia sp.]|nr:endolytic transglycosylase MltG [Hanamia sp.]
MKLKKIILYFLLLIVIGIAFCAWNIFGPVTQNPEKKFLYIPTGAVYQQVKDSLLKNNIIKGTFWFDKIAENIEYPQKVKAGKYKIPEGMSLYHLLIMLHSGKQVPVKLVITKLRTKEDLAKKIAGDFETDSLAVIHFLNDTDSLKQFDVDTNTVLTDVIPNTYIFVWNTPMKKIFLKLYEEEQKFWNKERLEKAQQLQLTPQQVYTLASIVEEETNKQDDKGKIASVYINRLRKGMKLAADPTVKFALKDFGLKRIYNKYLETPSPFNTYLNKGLPPGPICTPSIKTIDAVLDSPQTDYLFFVARSDFSGYSNFASTYQQHQINAKAYQKALDSLIKSKGQDQ